MSARTRRRARLARASFGPEWRPLGGMAGWLVDNGPHRRRERFRAHLRAARRDLAASEARWEAAAAAAVRAAVIGTRSDYVLAGSAR